jgi:hypothetical protein
LEESISQVEKIAKALMRFASFHFWSKHDSNERRLSNQP